jgi:ornithine cyclodeaminase
MTTTAALTPSQTAQALPYPALAQAIEALLQDPTVQVPPRVVQAMAGGGKLLVMPAADSRIAITKLITFVAHNLARGLPAIQGDIVVFNADTGSRIATVDGPTVTARRTAAVSLLAAQKLAPRSDGPMLIVGAGVQGRSHLEAFHLGLGVQEFWVHSRTTASADALVAHAHSLGLKAHRVIDPNAVVADCPLIVSATSAQAVALHTQPCTEAFIAAVGAFTPHMVEWAAPVCQAIHAQGTLVVDTRDADHEAGDLLQAGIDVTQLPSLADLINHTPLWDQQQKRQGPVFFKSCGWAGWDLAAARCIVN